MSAKELKPDLILLDIGLPSLNGIEVQNRLRQRLRQGAFPNSEYNARTLFGQLSGMGHKATF
jgi:CheY-like chemotaxis protein